MPFVLILFSLILGVSLSAAARSADALVYDKLTRDCGITKNELHKSTKA